MIPASSTSFGSGTSIVAAVPPRPNPEEHDATAFPQGAVLLVRALGRGTSALRLLLLQQLADRHRAGGSPRRAGPHRSAVAPGGFARATETDRRQRNRGHAGQEGPAAVAAQIHAGHPGLQDPAVAIARPGP